MTKSRLDGNGGVFSGKLYHGTAGTFKTFDYAHSQTSNEGWHFTVDRKLGLSYARDLGGRLITVEVKRLRLAPEEAYHTLFKELMQQDLRNSEIKTRIRVELSKKYDGIDDGGGQVVVFDPKKIKIVSNEKVRMSIKSQIRAAFTVEAKLTPDAINERYWQKMKRNPEPYYRTTQLVPIEWMLKLPGNKLRGEGTLKKNGEYVTVPWDEFVQHIAEHGIEDPAIIHVGKVSRTVKLGEGNHRLAAAKKLGIKRVPARVVVGTNWGHEYADRQPDGISEDIISVAGEYFSADARPSSVFKSLKDLK